MRGIRLVVLINNLINLLIGLLIVSAIIDGVGVGVLDERVHELDAGLRDDLEDFVVDARFVIDVGVLVVQLDDVEDGDDDDEGEGEEQLDQ